MPRSALKASTSTKGKDSEDPPRRQQNRNYMTSNEVAAAEVWQEVTGEQWPHFEEYVAVGVSTSRKIKNSEDPPRRQQNRNYWEYDIYDIENMVDIMDSHDPANPTQREQVVSVGASTSCKKY